MKPSALITQLDIIWVVIGGLFLTALGTLFGFWMAGLHLKDRSEELDNREHLLRRQKIELQRKPNQETTSHMDQATDLNTVIDRYVKEQLEQKNLEFSILRQELELENRLLSEENDSLNDKLALIKGDAVHFSEIGDAQTGDVERHYPAEANPQNERSAAQDSDPGDFHFHWSADPAPQPGPAPEHASSAARQLLPRFQLVCDLLKKSSP